MCREYTAVRATPSAHRRNLTSTPLALVPNGGFITTVSARSGGPPSDDGSRPRLSSRVASSRPSFSTAARSSDSDDDEPASSPSSRRRRSSSASSAAATARGSAFHRATSSGMDPSLSVGLSAGSNASQLSLHSSRAPGSTSTPTTRRAPARSDAMASTPPPTPRSATTRPSTSPRAWASASTHAARCAPVGYCSSSLLGSRNGSTSSRSDSSCFSLIVVGGGRRSGAAWGMPRLPNRLSARPARLERGDTEYGPRIPGYVWNHSKKVV